MRIPNQIKLETEQAPVTWVTRLNKFFLQVISALEIIKSADRYIDVTATGASSPSPVTVVVSRNSDPVKAMMLVRVTDVERPIEPVILQQPFWTQNGATVSASVAGLTDGRLYKLRFLLKQEL